MTEITLRWNSLLWLANIDCSGPTTLFWDLQIDNKVVYEYIECYMTISEMWADFSVKFSSSNITVFVQGIHYYTDNYKNLKCLRDLQLEIVKNTIERIISRLKTAQ